MKKPKNYHNYLSTSGIILCLITIWLLGGCLSSVGRKSEMKLTVQDTTGKSLSGVGVTLIGFKADFTSQKPLETLNSVTDQNGLVQLSLSWPKGVSYYTVFVNSYTITDCSIPGDSQGSGSCSIRTDQNISVSIQVKKL